MQDVFNHWNVESFYVARWMIRSPFQDTETLVSEAYHQVEDDERCKQGMAPWMVAQERLAHVLETWLGNAKVIFNPEMFSIGVHKSCWAFGRMDAYDSLFLPLLSTAIERVETFAVAEALMKYHGRWIPDIYSQSNEPSLQSQDDSQSQREEKIN